MARTQKVASDREQAAERLLGGSVNRSYDPVVDIDWDAPLDPDRFFLPPRLLSLYRTPLWEQMTHAQRVELSRQEMANVMSVGIWFENVLNQALLRRIFEQDPTSRHVHYALTEMGDECRHMLMFGRLIDKLEARPYRLGSVRRGLAKNLPLALRGTMLWVAALVGEEIFDALQRQMMSDPDLQPIVHQVMRIHVTEEARHIRYARESVVRRLRYAPRWEKETTGRLLGLGGPLLTYLLTNPEMYKRAGLDPREALRQARANPHAREAMQGGFAKLLAFLRENDLMKGQSMALWRRAGFIADGRWPRRGDFELGTGDAGETHRGPATITAGDTEIPVEVHLGGHLQPIDGSYRWYGRIAANPDITALHKSGRQKVTIRIPGGPESEARLTELDPMGNARITGVGQPPHPVSQLSP